MLSARTAQRTTSNSKIASMNNQTNGSTMPNDGAPGLNFPTGSNAEFDSNLHRSSLQKNISQYEGIYRNARFIHAISSGLVGQQVIIQTSNHGRFHGVLDTLSPNGDIALTASHRMDKNNNDILAASTSPIDLLDTIDSSLQTFELYKRIIKAADVVEMVAVDVDLSANAKCALDDNAKTSQIGDDRFSRIEHFYGSEDVDPETFEELDVGEDGKAGFDPEDMFHTNREKFNTTTDFDESKYTNVPVPTISEAEFAEIEKKVQEIELGTRTEDIDEDDAGVKRSSEANNLNDRNSNSKANRPNRNDFRYDNEYSLTKRDGWRDSRSSGANTNRRGVGNNSRPNYYTSTHNRLQYNSRGSRNNRALDNRSTYQARDSTLPMTATNEESSHSQRMNSGDFSQGQSSDSAVHTRTIYPSANRASANRNSPTPYTGSSSSRTNSITAPSPPANLQSGANKFTKKSSFSEQQSINDETGQLKQPHPSSDQTATSPESKQQQTSNPDENVPNRHTMMVDQANATGTITPNSTKSNGGLNPEADEFVPVFSRDSGSRPESRGGSTASSTSTHAFIGHTHPQSIHLLHHQQQTHVNSTPPMIPTTPTQTAAALYPQYYSAAFPNMPQLIGAAPQPITVGVMSAPIIPSQALPATGPNTNNSSNGSSSGMTTPNSSVSAGPSYKTNNNQANSTDSGATGGGSVASKKAVVSVQRTSDQSSVPQQHVPTTPSMMYPGPQIRYYTPDILQSQAASPSMHVPPIPIYYHMNPHGFIQATTAAGQAQNIMIPPGTTAATSTTQGLQPIHYPAVYSDPRIYLYPSATGMHPNWPLTRSPPQQSADQQRSYGGGPNQTSQQATSTGATNTGGRPTSATGQTNTSASTTAPPPVTPQYTINGAIATSYPYATPAGWMPGSQSISPLSSSLSQINPSYNIVFDPSQPITPQQAAYVQRVAYETNAYVVQPQPPPPASSSSPSS